VQFATPEEELVFLRGLVRVSQMADEILEDCLERRLGLNAAVDVFLAQTARMVHAQSGFVQLCGTQGPVLTRVLGVPRFNVQQAAGWEGPVPLDEALTAFVAPLALGNLPLGSFGLVLEGHFPDGGAQVQTLVRGMAEQLDSAVLSFLALSEGRSPLERMDELSEEAVFRPKGRIGRYELVTPLGTGGMAQVMVARAVGPEGLGRLVALKRILPHLAAEREMVEQFLDEARIGLRLSHPNLVTVYDFGEVGGAYYIAMELVRGVDFDHVIYGCRPPLVPKLAVGVVLQALSGLHAAHELRTEDGTPMGLVHRDLSPHNLMIGFDGRVKLLDFGVAKAHSQRTVTLPGIVKGKPLYMSPEQACGEPVDRRSDLFSMATILYEALTAERPFDRKNDAHTMEAIVHDPFPRHPAIPGALMRVLERAFAKDPSARFQSAPEFQAHLAAAITPATDAELAAHLLAAFPDRAHDYDAWERLGKLPSPPAVAFEPTVIRPRR
jgi:eukaryotic-like serine/threonine-protein kinase